MRDLSRFTPFELLAEIDRQLGAAGVLQDRVDEMNAKIGERLDFVRDLYKEIEARTAGDAVND